MCISGGLEGLETENVEKPLVLQWFLEEKLVWRRGGKGEARRKPRSRPKLCFARFPNLHRISESAFCLLDLTRLSPARGWPYLIAPRIPPGQAHSCNGGTEKRKKKGKGKKEEGSL